MADIRKAISILVGGAPFEASVLSTMTLTPEESIDTAATDCVAKVIYNPAFFAGLDDDTAATVLAHEAWHKAMLHHLRRGARDQSLWNMAADFVINGELRRRGFRFNLPGAPADIATCCDMLAGKRPPQQFPYLFDGSVGPDVSAEQVYDRLAAACARSPGASGSGSGSGSALSDRALNGLDVVMDSQESGAAQRVVVEVAAAAAAAKAMGAVSALVERTVGEAMRPRADWRRVLASVLTTAQSRVAEERSWARPHRRSPAPVIMPSRRRAPAGELALVVDTSGSISDALLGAFEACIRDICSQTSPEKVHVIYCDSAVNRTETVDDPRDIVLRPCGGGGTDFRPPFDWLAASGIRPSAVVYFTDGYGTFPTKPPAYPVVWAFTTDCKAPWGRAVRVEI
jgi:predicted metal-dependent peptidase